MTTFTSSSTSVGINGIVNLLLRDWASGGWHERQGAFRLLPLSQTLGEVAKQLFLLR